MRLLEVIGPGHFRLTPDLVNHSEPYAILSHTWRADNEEVTFQDMIDGTGKNKEGYKKIQFCGDQAARDGLRYFWVDTCCIDKTSSAVLSEALNSMFRWYHDSQKCYVYLSDVEDGEAWEKRFQLSRWFTRGWTLQELLAPRNLEFYSKGGTRLGDKTSLEKLIHEITDIPLAALSGQPLWTFSAEQRLGWAGTRDTAREEDKAYSLFGIFGISLPVIYGEGEEKAINRLHKEIMSSTGALKSKVANWLSPFDFANKQQELYRRWTQGTCDWFLTSDEFRYWSSESNLSRKEDQALWCSGMRKLLRGVQELANNQTEGTGKSILWYTHTNPLIPSH